MASEFVKKYGDTEPPLLAQLIDATGTPAALGAATVALHIQSVDGVALVLPATVYIGDLDGVPVTEFDGYVLADLAGDLLVPGIYEAEWQVTWSDAAIQTFPNDAYFLIKIVRAIA